MDKASPGLGCSLDFEPKSLTRHALSDTCQLAYECTISVRFVTAYSVPRVIVPAAYSAMGFKPFVTCI